MTRVVVTLVAVILLVGCNQPDEMGNDELKVTVSGLKTDVSERRYRHLQETVVTYETTADIEIVEHAGIPASGQVYLSTSDDNGFKPRRDHGAGSGMVFVSNVSEVVDRRPGLEAHYGPMAATSTQECELAEQMLPLFRHLHWRGPLEVELKRDTRTGAACVLEVNPRFSGPLPSSLNFGVERPGALVDASLDQSTPRALRDGLLPLVQPPVGNPYPLEDPAASMSKRLFQVAEAIPGRGSLPGVDPS